jgi:hypothetical protein
VCLHLVDVNLEQEWRDDPPVATLKRFVDAHIVDRQVLLFHSLVIHNPKCGTQRLRCYSGTHQFAGAKTQDIICAIPSKLPVHERKQWQWNPRADATSPSESFEVGLQRFAYFCSDLYCFAIYLYLFSWLSWLCIAL